MYVKKTQTLLNKFIVGGTYLGYEPCVDSVKLIIEEPGRLTSVTKCLYPDAAKKCGTSAECVERNIRKLAEVVWKNGGREYFYNITGELYEKRPPNTKFLKLLVNYVLDEETTLDPCRRCKIVAEKEAEIKRLNERIKELTVWYGIT